MAIKHEKYTPDYIFTPGDILEEYLEAFNMTQAELASRCEVTAKTINEIIAGKSALTPNLALKLEKVLNRPAQFWNNLETLYKDKLARRKEEQKASEAQEWLKGIPIAELSKRGLINTNNKSPISEIVNDVLKFFGVASVHAWQNLWNEQTLAARKSISAETILGHAAAWIRQGELCAQQMSCADFNKTSFATALQQIRNWTIDPIEQSSKRIKEICAKCGVVVAFIPEMDKVPWNGATKWLAPKKALIILNIRGRGEDIFWFSFFHEACHVLNEDSKTRILIDQEEYKDSPEERRADKYAADILIPESENSRIMVAQSKKQIRDIAKNLNVSPGIVAGRYRKLTGKWAWFNDLTNKLRWKTEDC